MTDYKQKMFAVSRDWLMETCYLKPDGNVRRHYSDEVNALIDSGLDQAANAIVSNTYAKIARRYKEFGVDVQNVDQNELDAFAFRLLTKTISLPSGDQANPRPPNSNDGESKSPGVTSMTSPVSMVSTRM